MPPERPLQTAFTERALQEPMTAKCQGVSGIVSVMKNVANIARTVAFLVMSAAVVAGTVASLLLS
jgi:hypothetical protein